jgi:pSer/pThr/pTyr-binding forkhead associated (FHA) protein
VPPIEGAAPVPPAPLAPPAPQHESDGLTRSGEPDLEQPAAPAAAERSVARLEFAHGESVDVDRVVIVGRAPEAGRFSQADQPRLVPVPSPHQEISSTHVEIRPGSGAEHGAAVVTDLGSTNGTVVVQPGLGPEELRPGVPVQLAPGALIDLGDGMTIRVTQP